MRDKPYRHPKSIQWLLLLIGFIAKYLLRLVWRRPSKRSRGLIRYGDYILLVTNITTPHHWTLPGGGYKKGESTAACASREIQEELGMTISATKFHSPSAHRERIFGIEWHYDCIQTSIKTLPDISLSYELYQAQWFHVSTLPVRHSGYIDSLL
jgi:8-oxo-dGTP pyrophosphatase MutT (NUDIX family)